MAIDGDDDGMATDEDIFGDDEMNVTLGKFLLRYSTTVQILIKKG